MRKRQSKINCSASIHRQFLHYILVSKTLVPIIRAEFPLFEGLDSKMSDVAKPTELLPLVTDIVAAHLSNNNVPSAELPQLIREVYHALAIASTGGPAPAARRPSRGSCCRS